MMGCAMSDDHAEQLEISNVFEKAAPEKSAAFLRFGRPYQPNALRSTT